MTAPALLMEVVAALDAASIPHMLVGSFASSAYSSPRSTQDIDMVIDPAPEALGRFVASFDSERIYVDGAAAQDALLARDQSEPPPRHGSHDHRTRSSVGRGDPSRPAQRRPVDTRRPIGER